MQVLTFLEQSSCAFSWINKRRDGIEMHVKTVKIIFSSRCDKPCKLYTHAEVCLEF